MRPPFNIKQVSLALLGLSLAACSKSTLLPVELGSKDIALVAYFEGGETKLQVFSGASGPVKVPADSDRPAFVYLGVEDDFVHPDGSSYTAEELSQLSARWTEPEAGSEMGGCGRCLAPAYRAPQLLGPGDACGPTMTQAALRFEGGSLDCSSTEDRPSCALANEDQAAEIEQVRREIHLAVPGACGCQELDPVDLNNFSFEPLTPEPHPIPLGEFAPLSGGRVFAVGDYGAAILEPGKEPVVYIPSRTWAMSMSAAVTVSNDRVLVTGGRFATGSVSEFGFLLFDASGPTLSEPIELFGGDDVRSIRVEHLEPGAAHPLYLMGSRYTTSIQPSIAVCDEELQSCNRVNLRSCPGSTSVSYIRDAMIFPSGAGLAVADKALYLRSSADPDNWDCRQDTIPTGDGSTEDVSEYSVGARVGNRAFVCFLTKEGPCTARRPAVATATVGAEVGPLVVNYVGPAGATCREFLNPPGSDTARLLLSGERIVDFVADGSFTETNLEEVLGDIAGYQGVNALADGRWVLRARENRVELYDGNERQTVYGADPRYDDPEVTLAAGNGSFVVLSDKDLHRVSGDGTISSASGAEIFDDRNVICAARDTAGTIAAAGTGPEGPWIAWLRAEGSNFSRGAEPSFPEKYSGRHVRSLAAVAPDNFIALLNGNVLFRVKPDSVEEITIDWDDPETVDVEAAPTPRSGQCFSDDFADNLRRVHGTAGAAWVVGGKFAFRVVGNRAERFGLPDRTNLSQARGSCPDTMISVGRRSIDEGPFFYDALRVQQLQTQEAGAHRHRIEEIDSALFDQSPEYNRRRPLDIFVDRRQDGRPGYGIVMEDGHVYRPYQATRYQRAPLFPRSMAQNPDGQMLLVTGEDRMVLINPP